MTRIIGLLVAVIAALIVSGCASTKSSAKQQQVASVLAYLYPGTEQKPEISDRVAEIKVPFRIGVAFVPDDVAPESRLPESDRLRLGQEVRAAFSRYPFISEIVVVPSLYLERGGSFANLDRVAALLKLDAVALISFDQVQNAGPTGWSFLYWTGVGAYVIDGDQYDILTAVETVVFDIKSRRLLMRAGGISNIKGTASMVGFSEQARLARSRGFSEGIKEMIGNLQGEVKAFRERAAKDPSIRLILPPGYNPNATRPAPQ